MALKVHEPEIGMDGGQVIRVANEDRTLARRLPSVAPKGCGGLNPTSGHSMRVNA
jgi:hypothetical protein